MRPRLPYFLLFLFLFSFTNDKGIAWAKDPAKITVSKQKVLPLALQYRLQILHEIEASALVPTQQAADLIVDDSQFRCFEQSVSLASSDPLSLLMSLQL
ncbi:MAG: hypothetical protein HY040_26995 [Planctomycetes bacterium]|nr:hypothetical protein [Planctomycetota bacterium]